MNWTILLSLTLLASLVAAELPSDTITYQEPPQVISLQNVAPSSALAIDKENAGLEAFIPWVLPNLGHYGAEPAVVVQKNEGLNPALLNFSAAETSIPESINESEEVE